MVSTWIVLGLWALLVIIKFKRLGQVALDFSLWLIVLVLLTLVQFNVFIWPLGEVAWVVYGGALVSLALVDAWAMIKGIDRSETFQSLQEKYNTLVQESEALRERFVATIDVLKDGLVYHDHEDRLFFTEPAMNLLELKDPEMSYETFLSILHPDDQKAYQEHTQKGLKSGKKNLTKVRVKKGHHYIWLELNGVSVKVDKKNLTVFQLRAVDVRQFPRTDVDVLNTMLLEDDCDHVLSSLHQSQTPYSVIAMRLSNIPGLNAKYGRDVGDMLMGEFLKKMRYHFIKEDQRLFRLQGILFIMVLTDERKTNIFKTALKEDSGLLQTTMQIGGVNESIYPYFGIVTVKTFGHAALEMKNQAIEALKESIQEQTQENYYFKEF
jgi:GGDEF domain-containing protein